MDGGWKTVDKWVDGRWVGGQIDGQTDRCQEIQFASQSCEH